MLRNENSKRTVNTMQKIIKATTTITIRFSETDAMGVVWHGNYLKYFEDAREFFGEKYKMTYLDIFNNGYFTPIVKSEINHKKPLYYGEKAIIEIGLEICKAAKIIHHYTIKNAATEAICATGKTIQVFMSRKNNTMELNYPTFYAQWLNKFKQ